MTINSIIEKMFFWHTYGIAYKSKGANTYIAKLPTYRYSYADPFVFEYDGVTAIFCELMDYHYGWGTIGAFEIKNGKLTSVKEIIREDNHMSFPNVFEFDKTLYMIPETYSSGEVHLYKCVDYPYKWEKLGVLLRDARLVDTAVLVKEDYTYLISYDLDTSSARCFYLDWEKLQMIEFFPKGNYCKDRAGGTFYNDNGIIKRIIQDCTNGYGDYIKIYTLNEISRNSFSEVYEKSVRIEDISFDRLGNRFEHVHQYSTSENYEVVDFFYRRFYWNKLIRSLTRMVFHPNRFFC